MANTEQSPSALWNTAFQQVRQTVQSPMVWLAMQAAVPITIDGNFFVVGLGRDKQYLAGNLQTFETVTAIEDALKDASGHILALRLIEGETQADYEAVRWRLLPAQATTEQAQVQTTGEASVPSAAGPTLRPEPPREVSASWEKLHERLAQMYKGYPAIRYPHGQARYVLEAVRYISDTMDVLMPAKGQPQDDTQERNLSRALERLSGTINLDPIFLALELFRYRDSRGK